MMRHILTTAALAGFVLAAGASTLAHAQGTAPMNPPPSSTAPQKPSATPSNPSTAQAPAKPSTAAKPSTKSSTSTATGASRSNSNLASARKSDNIANQLNACQLRAPAEVQSCVTQAKQANGG